MIHSDSEVEKSPAPWRRISAGAVFITFVMFFITYEPRPDRAWQSVQFSAPWTARDRFASVVHNKKIWVIGGAQDFWEGSTLKSQKFDEVWSSEDGSRWQREAAAVPFLMRTYMAAATYQNRIWVLGGWDVEGRNSSEAWSFGEADGWKLASARAPWGARGGSAAIAFRGKLWLFGGTKQNPGERPSNYNDVWSTVDGQNWELETPSAEWQPRAYHQVVEFKDRLWLIGGGEWYKDPQIYADVWSSADGVSWMKETDKPSWGKRLWSASSSDDQYMWITGGTSLFESESKGAVWFSRDGRSWEPYLAEGFPARRAHGALILGDYLYVVGGGHFDAYNDVWKIERHLETRTWQGSLARRMVNLRRSLWRSFVSLRQSISG